MEGRKTGVWTGRHSFKWLFLQVQIPPDGWLTCWNGLHVDASIPERFSMSKVVYVGVYSGSRSRFKVVTLILDIITCFH